MNVVAEMLLTDRSSLTVWATLLVAAGLSVAMLARADGVPHPHQALLESVSLRARRARKQREAQQAVRFAGELEVAAQRAAAAADQWRAHWQHTQRGAAAAWQSWQDAEQWLAVGRRAAAFAMPPARTPGEYADRELFLIRAVTAAVDRGDLPARTLSDAITGRNGWNPRLHPVEQEFAVRRAVATERQRRYHLAAAAERTAWHDTELAHATRDSLQQEATLATIRATAVRHLTLPAPARAARPALAPAGG
jgi:hypothetical protein